MKNKVLKTIGLLSLALVMCFTACGQKEKKDTVAGTYRSSLDNYTASLPRRLTNTMKFSMTSADKLNDPNAQSKETSIIHSVTAYIYDGYTVAKIMNSTLASSTSYDGYYYGGASYALVNGELRKTGTFLSAEDYLDSLDVFHVGLDDESVESFEEAEENGTTTYKVKYKIDRFPKTVEETMPMLGEYIEFTDDEVGIDTAELTFTVLDNKLTSSNFILNGKFNKSTEFPTLFSMELNGDFATDDVLVEIPEDVSEKILDLAREEENGEVTTE